MVPRCNAATLTLEAVHQPTGNTALGLSSISPEEPLVTILKMKTKDDHFLIQLMYIGICRFATEITVWCCNRMMDKPQIR
jgi:hypothetical protein